MYIVPHLELFSDLFINNCRNFVGSRSPYRSYFDGRGKSGHQSAT